MTVSSVLVLIEAVKRIASPEEVSAQGMLWMAVFGIVINGAAALRVKKGSSLNERSVYLHIMEDVLGWVGVFVVSIVMMFTDLPVLDPLLSVAISVWVLSNVYKNLRGVFKVLLQAVPDDIPMEEIERKIIGIEGIISVHDMHIWSLDGESHVMTLHVVSSGTNNLEIKKGILDIGEEYHIVHITVEFELPDSMCITNCD